MILASTLYFCFFARALGSTYIFKNGPEGSATWEQAQTLCEKESDGGQLATIPTKEANAKILKQIGGDYGTQSKWFGLKYDMDSTKYTWVDDTDATDVVYASWHETNNIEGGPCGALKENGNWQTDNCEDRKDFICEIPWHSSDIGTLVFSEIAAIAPPVVILAANRWLNGWIAVMISLLMSIISIVTIILRQSKFIFIVCGIVLGVTVLTVIFIVAKWYWAKKKNKENKDTWKVMEFHVLKK